MRLIRTAALVFAIFFYVNGVFAEQSKIPVDIGAIIPLTGPVAPRGQDVVHFAEILIPELNELSKTHTYKLHFEDGKCGAGNSATTAAKKFISAEGYRFLITGCSGETLQVGPIAERAHVVTIAVTANHPAVSELGEFIFRTFPNIKPDLQLFAKYVARESKNRYALITEENAFTAAMRDTIESATPGAVVFSDDIAADLPEHATLLTRIKAARPNAIYFNVMSEGGLAAIVKEARALGIEVPFFTYLMPEAAGFRRAAGSAAEGMEFIGSPEIGASSPEFQKRFQRFKAKFGEPSSEFILRTFHDALFALFNGIERHGPDANKVKNFLYEYRTFGALGDVQFDRNGDIPGVEHALKKVVNGEIEVLGTIASATTDEE